MNGRRIPPIAVDGLLAIGLFALGLVSRVEIGDEAARVYTRSPDTFNLLLIALQSLPLVLRRRYPLAVMATTIGAFAVDRVLDYPNTIAGVGFVVAVHALGSELPPRRSLMIGIPTTLGLMAFTLIGALSLESVGYEAIATTGIATTVPLLLGREVYQRRRQIQELADRAERAEREREERARQAVAEERTRIARELHDVVAHQMAVMTLQAEGARRLGRDADPRITDALDTITQAGHDALHEMRRMVSLLRGTDGSPAHAELAPQPGLSRLDELVDQMGDAGLRVEIEEDGHRPALSTGIDLNLYRIIQESLTNTLKHGGPGATATVRLRYPDESVEVEISDDGLGSAGRLNNGHGLVGMRERVSLLHGTLETGPNPGGGFRVLARVPLAAT